MKSPAIRVTAGIVAALLAASCSSTSPTASPSQTATLPAPTGSSPASTASGPPPSVQPTLSVDKLTVAYGPIVEPQGVAHQLGWFEQDLGVPIDWITLNGGAATIAALQSGSLQIGCGTGTPPITAAVSQGIPLDLFWIQDNAPESLVVKPGISSLQDLKGKKVTTLIGSTMYYDLVVALNKEGIALSDVQVVDLPVDQGAAAFKRGDVSADFTVPPFDQQLVDAGGVLLMSRQQAFEKYGYALFDACFTSRDWASQHQDVLAKWVSVENRAIDYVKTNPDAAYAADAKLLGITSAEAKVGMATAEHPTAADQVTSAWMGAPGATDSGIAGAIRTTAALAFSLGRIAQLPADPQSVVDSRAVALVAAGQ